MEMRGAFIRQEILHLSLFKGEGLTIYMHDGEHGRSGDKFETVYVAVTPEGEFILQTGGLEASRFLEFREEKKET